MPCDHREGWWLQPHGVSKPELQSGVLLGLLRPVGTPRISLVSTVLYGLAVLELHYLAYSICVNNLSSPFLLVQTNKKISLTQELNIFAVFPGIIAIATMKMMPRQLEMHKR